MGHIAENDDIYRTLEQSFLTYRELKTMAVRECGEDMVPLSANGIAIRHFDTEIPVTGAGDIYVRRGVMERLLQAQKNLAVLQPRAKLLVFYGYRSPDIQRKSFDKIRRSMGYGTPLSDMEMEQIHRYVAVPDVAGHPTGGAVDITLVDAIGEMVDMGTAPHAFERDSYSFSPFISKTCILNRQLLRTVMLQSGFAPFDGEWWHFSYGDREWACYWNKPHGIYGELEFFSES